MVNTITLDAAVPGFTAVSFTVPALTMSAAGIATRTLVALIYVLVRWTPFHSTAAPGTKLVPVTVR